MDEKLLGPSKPYKKRKQIIKYDYSKGCTPHRNNDKNEQLAPSRRMERGDSGVPLDLIEITEHNDFEENTFRNVMLERVDSADSIEKKFSIKALQ